MATPHASATPSSRGRIKGAAFREFVLWWQRTRGSDAVEAALQRVSPQLRAALDLDRPALGILASSWYPAELPHALVDSLVEPVPKSQWRDLADEGAEAVMRATLRGVYKAAFALLASPERYVKYCQKIWDMHYDTGRVVLTPVAPTEHLSVITDWQGHSEFICMLNTASAVPIYRAMGFEHVEVTPLQCVAEGHLECRSRVAWR